MSNKSLCYICGKKRERSYMSLANDSICQKCEDRRREVLDSFYNNGYKRKSDPIVDSVEKLEMEEVN